jgi:hypothetical protein
MRLILAHEGDGPARQLAARWGPDAILLHPGDLHTESLSLTVDTDGTANAELRSRPRVTSVVSRIGGVGPGDLHHIDRQDLAYAAAELDAFLRAWLLAWPGPVLNRPTTTSLNGPGWRTAQWAVAATAAGLTMGPPGPVPGAVPVAVVGDRFFGDVPASVGQLLCALAEAAGCTLLAALMNPDGTLAQAGASPDVSAPQVADALASLLDRP